MTQKWNVKSQIEKEPWNTITIDRSSQLRTLLRPYVDVYQLSLYKDG